MLQFITNHQMSDALFKRMSALKLLKPGDTRFATSFIMLQRMKAVKLKLVALLVDEEYVQWAAQRQYKEASEEAADTLYSREFWKQVCGRTICRLWAAPPLLHTTCTHACAHARMHTSTHTRACNPRP